MTRQNTKSSQGLRGIVVGQTLLSTVGQEGEGLTYRGYAIEDLAAWCSFEEVAFLLLRGHLPSASEYEEYKAFIKEHRSLPQSLKTMLESVEKDTHPMDVLRTACAYLGTLQVEDSSRSDQMLHADSILAKLPSALGYWYQYAYHHGKKVSLDTDEDSTAGHLLALITQDAVSDLAREVMNVSLILYAEHGFNASTFVARICASTLSDIYSCVTGAIGTLRGELHGGANEKAKLMLSQWSTCDEARQGVREMLARKEKVMGFGHAIYRKADPRSVVIQGYARRLAENTGDSILFELSEAVEEVVAEEKGLFPNADFYHATAYSSLGIPTDLFTPLFVCSRVTGWCAHVFEQRSNNRIIRPSSEYVGPSARTVIPLSER